MSTGLCFVPGLVWSPEPRWMLCLKGAVPTSFYISTTSTQLPHPHHINNGEVRAVREHNSQAHQLYECSGSSALAHQQPAISLARST